MSRFFRPLLLAAGLVASVATSPPEYGDADTLALGSVVLDSENPTFDVDVSATLEGADGDVTAWLIFDGAHASTTSSDLVLLDRASGEELDRRVLPGGFADDPEEVRVSFDLEWDTTEPLQLQVVLEGEGPFAAEASIEASFSTQFEPEGEITLTLEPA